MQLLKYFHELSLHPNNAKELKGLILQLAVQGKLTSDFRLCHPELREGSHSATALLNQIKVEKEQLIKEKKIKKDNPLPAITPEEIPYELPDGWSWCRLGGIGYTNIGLTYSPRDISDKGIPVLRSSNIQDGEIYLNDLVRVDRSVNEKVQVQNGDILICARNGSKRLVGKCAIIKDLKEETAFGAFMAIFRSNFNPYIKYFIESPVYRRSLEGVSTTTINQITQSNLKETLVPLPPLPEQKAIVETVNQLFKEVEQLEQLTVERVQLKEQFATSALNQLATNNTVKEWAFLQEHFHPFFNHQPNIKKLRETILQLAVQGKLTTHFRIAHPELREGVHSAAALLEQIKTEKVRLVKEKKIKKENPLPAITKEEVPYELPEGWVWCRLGEILLYSDAGKSPDCEKRPSQNNEWGVLTTTSIQVNSFNEMANKVLPVNYVINPNQVVKYGDILITRAGPINRTGIACKVNFINSNLILSDKTIRLNYPENLVNPDFVVSTLNSVTIRKILLRMMIGMASSQVNISQANIKTTSFPLPPFEEQKAIVETVNRLMTLCDQLEQEVQQSEQQVELVMKGVLREVLGR